MNCPACGFENPDRMRFCGRCAHVLDTSCPHCGFENPTNFTYCGRCSTPLRSASTISTELAQRDLSSYTPKHLADKILQSKSVLEGEKKHVTVLFVDVKGSMKLVEGMDPEEWHRILDHFFKILTDCVHCFDGNGQLEQTPTDSREKRGCS